MTSPSSNLIKSKIAHEDKIVHEDKIFGWQDILHFFSEVCKNYKYLKSSKAE